MSTVAPKLVLGLARDWERCFTSAKMSGCVGDAAHAATGGYHIGRRFQPSDNYSVVRPDDGPGNGPDDAAAAIDMTLNASDMRTCTTRLISAFSNLSDPRRKYLNAFNGTTDGKTARRWDVYAQKVKSATSDHLWHVHLEIRRKYVESPTAMAAILSILRGESVSTYLGRVAPGLVASASRSVAPPYPGHLLQRNDSQKEPDESVRMIQEQLLKRGWASIGQADGFFGPKLESVIKKWQAAGGLAADGVIGPATWPTPWTRPVGA